MTKGPYRKQIKMQAEVRTHPIHRIIITLDDEFFTKLHEKWDLQIRIPTRRGMKKVDPRPTAKQVRNNISQRMWGTFPGGYGSDVTGWGPLSHQMRVEWPQHLSGGITPFDVEIVVEIDETVPQDLINEKMVADHWESIIKIHLGDPIPLKMYVDVRIVRVKSVHHKFLIGEPAV